MSNIPGSFSYIQQESLKFNQPVSEASLSAMGASINGLLSIICPVGTILESMLTEAQFQTQLGNPSPATWVLADGRSAVGTTYQSITGFSTVPDLRGIFTRGKNNGRSDGNQNPDGDLPLGTYTADKFASHSHTGAAAPAANGPPAATTLNYFGNTTSGVTGGNETAPKNVTVNCFIRIN